MHIHAQTKQGQLHSYIQMVCAEVGASVLQARLQECATGESCEISWTLYYDSYG